MTKKQYRFWVYDEKTQKYLDEKMEEYGGFSDFAREIFEMIINNKLDPKSFDELKKEKIKADIEWKKAQTAYLKQKLQKPIPNSDTGVTAFNPPEEKNLAEFINNSWNSFVDTLRQLKEGWSVTCKLCETGFVQIPTHEMAINRFKKHLEETHAEELIRKNES